MASMLDLRALSQVVNTSSNCIEYKYVTKHSLEEVKKDGYYEPIRHQIKVGDTISIMGISGEETLEYFHSRAVVKNDPITKELITIDIHTRKVREDKKIKE